MTFVSISGGGLADWGFGLTLATGVPLNAIFGMFATACVVFVVLVSRSSGRDG